jgi:hypothetical protein
MTRGPAHPPGRTLKIIDREIARQVTAPPSARVPPPVPLPAIPYSLFPIPYSLQSSPLAQTRAHRRFGSVREQTRAEGICATACAS